MKNILTILVLVFTFTFTAQAQKKKGKPSVEKILKKMTKDLNLTETQQSKIKPLLAEQFADRKAMGEKRKAAKESGQKPSKEERKQLRKDRLAKETDMNTKMAAILDADQLVKFETMAKERKEKAKNRIKKKKQ
ncbi:Spy/CpxP family protein refolding chaperone [Polaribacter sp. Hel1_85]|uniref:Spy/CpxP family protein refolding chaperone n=1 Tax=Polaribacter sp. Hel1_85 TaxID=1250005 RepID=UPI00052C5D8B|nr:hypothetical protein [Polaribacter sp. Hel1_85]KGL61856.1 hypothetical protein PHEL85_1641 [Polaribacter sp. Hel1_85]